MDRTALILAILQGICFLILQGKALVVSRGKLDVFTNPNQTRCERNVQYCKDRRARCFDKDCCRCKCDREYSTFHSPGVTYEFKDGKPSYRFEGGETCVWNHYAHEGVSKNFCVEIISFIKHCESMFEKSSDFKVL